MLPEEREPVRALTIGRYALYDPIASGGMATVYYGRMLGPVGFAKTVAIKRLHPHYASDPEFASMFLDEARLAARIQHPNVVQTLDVVALKRELILVMEYVHGESLARLFTLAPARRTIVSARTWVLIEAGNGFATTVEPCCARLQPVRRRIELAASQSAQANCKRLPSVCPSKRFHAGNSESKI